MKSIAFIISSLGEGGSQRVAVNLANVFCSRYDVTIIALWDKGCVYKTDPRIKRYVFRKDTGGFSTHFRKKFPMLGRILWTLQIKRIVRPDVTISLLSSANFVNVLTPCGDRHIVSVRNDPSRMKKLHQMFENIALRLSDHTVFQSESVQKQFPEKVQKKSTIIRNPVTVSCTASSARTNRIVNIGRLVPQKNHKLLIEAFSEFQKIHPDHTLEIYGTGELEQDLREQIKMLGLEGKVILRGFAPDIHEQIRDAKMFVLSSDYEGLSNALSEAMMMGIACISTKVAGSTEIIRSMDNGILTDIGDRESLTKAMLLVAEDDDLRDKLQKNAAKTAEQFKTENIIVQWEALL